MPDPCTHTLPAGSTCHAGDHDGAHRHHTHHGGELEAPHRRIRLELDLGADDFDELAGALHRIANDVDLGELDEETHSISSGGWATGYQLKLTCDPVQTGDRFREQLKAWSDARKEARRG